MKVYLLQLEVKTIVATLLLLLYSTSREPFIGSSTYLGLLLVRFSNFKEWVGEPDHSPLDSIAVSLSTNSVSDGKIQISILILRRGPCLGAPSFH